MGEAVDNKGRPFKPAYSQPVPCCPLDEFACDFVGRAPNHIKLDVDGAELSVLAGAARTLEDPTVRSVLVEVEPSRQDADAILARLRKHGFAVHEQHSHGPGPESTANYILTRGA